MIWFSKLYSAQWLSVALTVESIKRFRLYMFNLILNYVLLSLPKLPDLWCAGTCTIISKWNPTKNANESNRYNVRLATEDTISSRMKYTEQRTRKVLVTQSAPEISDSSTVSVIRAQRRPNSSSIWTALIGNDLMAYATSLDQTSLRLTCKCLQFKYWFTSWRPLFALLHVLE